MEIIKKNKKLFAFILTIISIFILINFLGKIKEKTIPKLNEEIKISNVEIFANTANQTSYHTVKYYLENPLELSDNVVCDGFYYKGDIETTTYKKVKIDGTENFKNIGNDVLIGSDGSIKVSNDKKLLPKLEGTCNVLQLGGKANDTSIDNSIVINGILNSFQEVHLDKGTYYIKDSIIHNNANKIVGSGIDISILKLADNTNKYPIKSSQANLASDSILTESFEMSGFTIDGNRITNSTRDYTDNVFHSYWGFGAVLCNIRNLFIHDIKVKNTEAWGISYWLCGNIVAKNLQFDQDETSSRDGWNEDGITGSAKNIYIENVQGFTNDDMIGITTGTASLRGNDCGVTFNNVINNIVIKNIEGKAKNGAEPYSCIGIYGDKGATINKVSVDDVKGNFKYSQIRFADYWPDDTAGKPTIEEVFINSVSGQSRLSSPICVKSVNLDNMYVNTIDESNVSDTGIFKVLEITDSICSYINISSLTIKTNKNNNIINAVNCSNSSIENIDINKVYLHDFSIRNSTVNLTSGETINNVNLSNINISSKAKYILYISIFLLVVLFSFVLRKLFKNKFKIEIKSPLPSKQVKK